jgi:hypothetical protein
MVLILIKLYLSGRFTSIVIVNATIGVAVGVTIGITISITVEDSRFYPVAITIAIYVYILIISNAR